MTTQFHTPRDMSPEESCYPTDEEEMRAAASAIGYDLEDIKIEDDRDHAAYAPPSMRYTATWGDYDLGCPIGAGRTPEEAMWDLIDFTKAKRS